MKKTKRFLAVTLAVASIVSTFSLGVFAGSNLVSIQAYLNYGLKVVKNGVVQDLKDAQGNVVTPITYNDTTYLPVRAVANILGHSVGWDEATESVLLDGSSAPIIPNAPTVSNDTITVDKNTGYMNVNSLLGIVNNVAGGQLTLSTHSRKCLNKEMWVPEVYTVAGENAYAYPTIDFVSVQGEGHSTPAVPTALDAVEKELVANGFYLAKTDEYGQKHYVKGNLEIKVWNINNSNSDLSLQADTDWLTCCAEGAL